METEMNRLFYIPLLLLCHMAIAQDSESTPEYGWQKAGTITANLTQASFDNYIQGGENSTSWQIRLGFTFINDQERYNWSNTGKFEYGNTQTGDQIVQKSVDEIKIESVFTYKTAMILNPFVSFTAETQFTPGYDYSQTPKVQISNFLDPGFFRESIGLCYKPNDIINARLGAAMKQSVTDQFNTFSDDPNTETVESFKNEIGAESVIDVNYELSESNQLASKLELFSNLKAFDEIDVIWDTDVTAQITKLLAFTFNVKLVYDKDISTKRQLKQVMGLGISYHFF